MDWIISAGVSRAGLSVFLPPPSYSTLTTGSEFGSPCAETTVGILFSAPTLGSHDLFPPLSNATNPSRRVFADPVAGPPTVKEIRMVRTDSHLTGAGGGEGRGTRGGAPLW